MLQVKIVFKRYSFSAHPHINITFPVVTQKWDNSRTCVTPVDGSMRHGEMAAMATVGGESGTVSSQMVQQVTKTWMLD